MSTKLGLKFPPLSGAHPAALARMLFGNPSEAQTVSDEASRCMMGEKGYARGDAVGLRGVRGVADEDAGAEEVDVEEVVEEVHVVRGGKRAAGAVDRARERTVGRVERWLPHLLRR